MSLQAITVPAEDQPIQGLVVVLHGWGASSQDVGGLAPFINLPGCHLVFPDAPFPHPYASKGKMWYDFPSNFAFQSTAGFYDRPDLSTSRQLLKNFLKSLESETGVPLTRTILAGFSQGGAMALDVGLQLPLAGLMILSGYLHAPIQYEPAYPPPILMVHGRQDAVVPLTAAHQARDSLQTIKAPVHYEEFDMGHEIQPVVLNTMQNFVKNLLT